MKKWAVFFLINLIFGQEVLAQKKEVFFDDLLRELPRFETAKIFNENYFIVNKEDDTTIYHLKVTRKREGTLSEEEFSALQKNLNRNLSRPLAIEYYQGPDVCNGYGYLMDRVDWARLTARKFQIVPVDFILMYKTTEGLGTVMKKMNWVQDKDDLVHKIFLKIPFPCFSGIVIFPDRRFVTFKGEHRTEELLKEAKKTKK